MNPSSPLHEVISTEEDVIRCILIPFHVKKKGGGYKLVPAAFDPPRGRNDISVLRPLIVGVNFCKAYAKTKLATSGNSTSPSKKYVGLAWLSLTAIEGCGATCIVTPAEGVPEGGHADILLPPLQDGELVRDTPAEAFDPMKRASKCLVQIAQFLEDPDPDEERWQVPMQN